MNITDILLAKRHVPGCPSAGHLSGSGYWHPGSPRHCPKCDPAPRDWGSNRVTQTEH